MSEKVAKEYLLVTGGYGFIGAHFIEHIYNMYSDLYHIVNIDCMTYAADLNNLDPLIHNSPDYTF